MQGSDTGSTSIKQLIQSMTGGEVGIYQGEVISASPLKIQIVNDSSLIITEANTYIPRHLTNYSTTVNITNGSGSDNTGASMTVHNALKSGDTVHILSLYNGKQYYVLDRVA
ncbi:MAG: DUF2577 domain-containing protein [Clostridiales bacterium]|nr:DUF2577 domain-containing protein [Clostridiales bacterium]